MVVDDHLLLENVLAVLIPVLQCVRLHGSLRLRL